jgi:hypothetical protein
VVRGLKKRAFRRTVHSGGNSSSRHKRVSRSSECPADNTKNTKIAPKNALFSIAIRTIFCNLYTPIQTSNIEASKSSNYYYFPHVIKQDYNCAFNNTRKDALNTPELGFTLAAKIYHVKEEALRKAVLRSRQKERNSNGI